ncbi:hypothetical protein D1227_04890 [Henriciella mobilis]|uniref:hypothetical protein n=1 Tax=Henriciella mobilis TaxID=2305467 RepID=UPI000E662000|nr:hypothetical protein [Henriciella mobilis]RIJ17354.1 hypothetical protein D1231_03655 [Henriciella mobilis]RIJ25657.1 hypothetical protein D1227_04890 [Henriciella mobilis]
MAIGLLAMGVIVSGCKWVNPDNADAPESEQSADPRTDAPADGATSADEASAPFDASKYAAGPRGVPIRDGDLVRVQDDGFVITARGPNPSIGPGEIYPFEEGATYKVTVEYIPQEYVGEPMADIVAWTLNDAGDPIDERAYQATFHAGSPPVGALHKIWQTFRVGSSNAEDEGVAVIPYTDAGRGLRFTSNPLRGGDGSQARVISVSVTRQ